VPVDRKAANQWAFFSQSTRRNKDVFAKPFFVINRTSFCENDMHTDKLRETVKSGKVKK
jgi:hypothetical protein